MASSIDVTNGTMARRPFTSPKPRRRAPAVDDPAVFDLDDPQQWTMARQVFFSSFSGRARAAGLDLDDTFQEVALGLVRKGLSERSCWHPSRGSLRTWMHVATGGLVINLVAKAVRWQREQPGRRSDAATW